MIVITGATGNIGGELLRILSEQEVAVRAVSRRPPDQAAPPGVEWAAADLAARDVAARDTLAATFEGADRLFLLTGNVEDMVGAQKNAIAAAEAAGIRHVVKVSALGASDHSISVIGVWHHAVEQALMNADLEWTILRPHVFMQNVLGQAETIRAEGEVRSPAGDAAVPMIDTRDIAAVAAVVLTSGGHAGKRYTLTGPEPVTWREVAATLSDLLGRSVTYVAETEDEAWHRLHGAGMPPWLVGAQLALAAYQRRGGGTDIVTDAVERLTGRPPRSFRDFAADFSDDLRG